MGKIFAKSRPNHYRSQCARNPCGSCRNRSSARLFSRRAARHTPNAGRVRGREFCRRSPRRRARRSCRRGSTVYLRPQDPLRLARSSAGPPARQQERIADGARKARIPLNTNGSENDVRCQVTKRKISGGTRSDAGRDCRDGFLGLLKTCGKNGIEFWDYLGARLKVPGCRRIPALAEIVSARAPRPP